jgi:antitoxin (DNA-binding transcriptional repressor) of toxin-antitoxin stability system
MIDPLSNLDAAALLAAASGAVRERRLAEVRDLEVLAQWAALHAADPTEGPEGRHARRLGNVLVHLGGEGTPGVQDFCLGEIALARGTGVTASSNAIADALDLQHRLPRTWSVLSAGEAEVFIARRVAKLSRHLPVDRVGVVDAAVARIIAHEAGGRVLAVAEAKIIEADPALHDERTEAERARRYVGLGRTDELGLRTVIARVEAGDAVWVDATVQRVAEIIAPTHPHASTDELRAIAFGFLARPAELLQLLLEHNQPAADADDEHSRATAFPARLLDTLRNADFTPLAPRAVLYVHLHEAALAGSDAVARVEGLGPVSVSTLCRLLGRTGLTVRPVRDLSSRVRSTAYEHPESLKEQTYLRTGGDYWPFATSTIRRVDYDHPTPYDDTGPPQPPQTGSHNSGPLGRRHHRWKTHAGYRSRQCGDGRYVWQTPHGLTFLVDHLGTRRLDPEKAHAMFEAPAGVDLHFA